MHDANLIFIHGLEGSSQGVKARLLRDIFPGIIVPDFQGHLSQRMDQLESLLSLPHTWTIIGSSFGGLMAALYARHFPQRIQKLILLAPAILWPDFKGGVSGQITTPTIIYHGYGDRILPLDIVYQISQSAFANVEFHAVDDDHALHHTTSILDWRQLV
jgi:pimeloyl-ACP methyl ester carboxylesterase